MNLKKVISMAAISAMALAPKAAKAAQQPNKPVESINKTAIVQQVDSQVWQWQGGSASLQERAVYESLPNEYKAFANKKLDTSLRP